MKQSFLFICDRKAEKEEICSLDVLKDCSNRKVAGLIDDDDDDVERGHKERSGLPVM